MVEVVFMKCLGWTNECPYDCIDYEKLPISFFLLLDDLAKGFVEPPGKNIILNNSVDLGMVVFKTRCIVENNQLSFVKSNTLYIKYSFIGNIKETYKKKKVTFLLLLTEIWNLSSKR
ncbi:hypothetical protein ANTPLA_LOCUS10323 [Anthophora plagiata]